MAAFGIGELVLMLLLGGVLPTDVEPLPVDQVLAGMPADCELVAYQDFRGAYGALQELLGQISAQPWVAGNPEVAAGLSELSSRVSGMPTAASTALGVDPFTAFHAANLCGRLVTGPSGQPAPSVLLVLQGDFTDTLAANLARLAEMTPGTMPNGVGAFEHTEDGVTFDMLSPQPGVLLFGTQDLVLPRSSGPLARDWESAGADTLVGRVRDLASGGPRSIIGFAPSAGTRFLLAGDAPVTLSQLVAGLDRAVWMSNGSTTYLETKANSPDAFHDQELIVSGLGDTLQASSHAARGLARLFLGLLSPDDAELDPALRSMLSHRDEVLSFLDGLGLFTDTEAAFNSDATAQTTSLTLTNAGGSLLVLGLVLGGMTSYLMFREGDAEPPDYVEPATPHAYP